MEAIRPDSGIDSGAIEKSAIEKGAIETAVNEFLLDTFFPEQETDLANNTDLVETGVLDSVSVLQLVDFMEEGYDLMIEPEDLFRLTSVENIAQVIREKSAD